LIQNGIGTIDSKTEALTHAGAQVFTRMHDVVDAVVATLHRTGVSTCD
jgi:hypothetical protein